MRKREEMLRDLHRRMDEYESDRRMKRVKVTKVAASATPVCAAAVVGVGLWMGGVLSSNNAIMSDSNVNMITAEQNTTEENIDTAAINTEAFIKQTESVTTSIRTTEAVLIQNGEIITQEQATEATEAQNVYDQLETTEIKVTEAVPTHQETTNASVYSQGTMGDMLAIKSVNGIVYLQFFSNDVYTCGEYIGESSAFIGFPEHGSIYLSNESSDVIILWFTADSQVTLKKTDISPEQYKIEYEQMKEIMNNGTCF